MGVSHANPVWKFKIDFVKKNWEKAWDNKKAFIKYWGLASKLKPIKSFDEHIFTKHVFNSVDPKSSKFIEWINIKLLIREWYNKSNKKIIKSVSENSTTWKIIDTLRIEVDMWKIIWKANKQTSKLRIIVDYEWNIVSSYPIDKVLIK